MPKKSNKIASWSEEHEVRLPTVLYELKDGGKKVTGKQVKSHDPLFALLDSAFSWEKNPTMSN